MRKIRFLSLLLALAICVQTFAPCASATVIATQTTTQQDIISALLFKAWTLYKPGEELLRYIRQQEDERLRPAPSQRR